MATLVTLRALNRTLYRVTTELDRLGFYDDATAAIDVFLVPAHSPLGLQLYGGTGEIWIPALSLYRLAESFYSRSTPLADVLRHEFGHAVADTHRGLIRSRRFSEVFHASHECPDAFEYDPELHVSRYAATNACEDFAEVFMLYVRHGGRLPRHQSSPWIAAKWRFVRQLGNAIRRGWRRWPG